MPRNFITSVCNQYIYLYTIEDSREVVTYIFEVTVGPGTVKIEVVPGKVMVVKDPDIEVVMVGPGTN